MASTDFQGTDDVPSSVVLLPNGQILEAGTSTAASGGSEFAVALFDANGTLDQTFGSGTGKVLTSFGSGSIDFANAVVLGNCSSPIHRTQVRWAHRCTPSRRR